MAKVPDVVHRCIRTDEQDVCIQLFSGGGIDCVDNVVAGSGTGSCTCITAGGNHSTQAGSNALDLVQCVDDGMRSIIVDELHGVANAPNFKLIDLSESRSYRQATSQEKK